MNTKVSIITPVYNSEKYLNQCIQSVLSQTYQNWELIFVDDCSTDNSANLIKVFVNKDKRIKYVKLSENSGAGVARNKGIEASSGKYLAFLDSDDFWHEEKLNKQVFYLKSNKDSIVYSQYYIVVGDSNIPTYKIKSPKAISYKQMLRNDYIGFLTFMYDVEKIGKIFMPEIRRRQDWAYKLKVLKVGHQANGIQEPLAYYRIGNSSLSSNKFKLIKYNFRIYNKELNFSLLKSMYFMIVFIFNYFIYKMTSKELVK